MSKENNIGPKLEEITKHLWGFFSGRKDSWKFARFCLGIGGAILAGPYWLPFLESIIERQTGSKISSPSPMVGVAVIALGAIPLITQTVVTAKRPLQEVDQAKEKNFRYQCEYAAAIHLALSGKAFSDLDHFVGDLHIMKSSHFETLKNTLDLLVSEEHFFSETNTFQAASVYENCLRNLLKFYDKYFEPPTNKKITDELWLFPKGNADRGYPDTDDERKYFKLGKQLGKLLDETGASRIEFIKSARIQGFIDFAV